MLADHLKSLHRKMRRQKIELFFTMTDKTGSLLDVGGATGVDGEMLPLYEAFHDIHTINLSIPLQGPPPSTFVVADACHLPYKDGAFDWVFSNAVIEHVPAERQRQFANEIRRVARRGYFVATPDRYFPIDPHTLLPGIQYLSPGLRRVYGHMSLRRLTETMDGINLLSARQMQDLFPEGKIYRLGFPVWPNNLVTAYSGSVRTV
jgi:SAM-dependent methyltransferase